MQTPKDKALREAVAKTRAAYFQAEEHYKAAMNVAFDTELQNQDGTYALHTAARASAEALESYSDAMKELAKYLTKPESD